MAEVKRILVEQGGPADKHHRGAVCQPGRYSDGYRWEFLHRDAIEPRSWGLDPAPVSRPPPLPALRGLAG